MQPLPPLTLTELQVLSNLQVETCCYNDQYCNLMFRKPASGSQLLSKNARNIIKIGIQ